MGNYRTLKLMVCMASAAFIMSAPTKSASAEEKVPTEQGVAGIACTLDNYFAYVAAKEDKSEKDSVSYILNNEIISPLHDTGVSIAETYVNIRSKPSTESEKVGKLYRGCSVKVLEWLDGGWVKIISGKENEYGTGIVEGYIASHYLAFGRDAEVMAEKYAKKWATINTESLRVRAKPSLDAKILEQISRGEKYLIIDEHGEWLEIILGNDNDGSEYTGFIHRDYVNIDIEFKQAISTAEEARLAKLEAEAIAAEKERIRKLAEQKAKEEERKRKAAEEAARRKKEEQENKNNNNDDKDDKDEIEYEVPSLDSGELSELRKEIVTYAQKFVGNKYVWGGTSLTKGADCSGFVKTIYEQFGYTIPRVSRDQAKEAGIKVDISDRKPGDLIFYTDSYGTVNHVAMYIGNDKVVHAASSREGIKISRYDYRKVYRIRRIVY